MSLSKLLTTAALGLTLLIAVPARAEPPQVSAPEFREALGTALETVPEFRFIREVAARLGVRVYLFGGTAAGLAHYVKWDLQRKKGDPRFQKERFDYDYTNIYRSTQDADLVVDGTAAQAQALEAALTQRFPHLQGSKSAWEVRLLRQSIGAKESLLDNPSFLNQHSDSNSTGLIEVSTPPSVGKKERDYGIVRDLRDWESSEPAFLKDVLNAKLHYYFSDKHETTQRAKDGLNPPILSVIRYLTKAFQYELEILPEDEAKIQRIIHAFSPRQVSGMNAYVGNWIEKNGKKLYQHAVNLDYAKRKLDEFGLRTKLADLGYTNTQDSLAWWMNKLPLPEFPVGQGSQQTAQELGITRVAHETKDFLAYESITRSHTGAPNVFESRTDAVGEAAVHGQGFYTAVGDQGARGTRYTIRFDVDPNARAGKDFSIVAGGSYIVFHNKAALRVVPESLNLNPADYFHALADGQQLSNENLGILEKLKRRLDTKLYALSRTEAAEIREVVRKALLSGNSSAQLWHAWVTLPDLAPDPELIALKHEIIRKQIATGDQSVLLELVRWHFKWPQAEHFKNLIGPLIEKTQTNFNYTRNSSSLLQSIASLFGQPYARDLIPELRQFIERIEPREAAGPGAVAESIAILKDLTLSIFPASQHRDLIRSEARACARTLAAHLKSIPASHLQAAENIENFQLLEKLSSQFPEDNLFTPAEAQDRINQMIDHYKILSKSVGPKDRRGPSSLPGVSDYFRFLFVDGVAKDSGLLRREVEWAEKLEDRGWNKLALGASRWMDDNYALPRIARAIRKLGPLTETGVLALRSRHSPASLRLLKEALRGQSTRPPVSAYLWDYATGDNVNRNSARAQLTNYNAGLYVGALAAIKDRNAEETYDLVTYALENLPRGARIHSSQDARAYLYETYFVEGILKDHPERDRWNPRRGNLANPPAVARLWGCLRNALRR